MGWKLVIGAVMIVLSSSFIASADTKEDKGEFVIETRKDGTKVKYKKKTSYDFEGADVEGLFKRPSGSYISNLKNVKGKSIIRIRRDFDPEITDSVRLLQ